MNEIPEFNPEMIEEEAFPIENDIEYVGGVRVSRVTVYKEGGRHLLWGCKHGQTGSTPEEAAANCVEYCQGAYPVSDPKHPEYHSTHADLWDLRDKGA